MKRIFYGWYIVAAGCGLALLAGIGSFFFLLARRPSRPRRAGAG
jgi:hypothetical protein